MTWTTYPATHDGAAADKAAVFLARVEAAVLLVLSPLFLFPPDESPFLVATLLVPVTWIVVNSVGGELLPLTPLNGSLLVLLCTVLVSLAVTYDLEFSTPKVMGVAFGVSAFFVVVRGVRCWLPFEVALDLFLACGVVLALLGLVGTNWIAKVALLEQWTRWVPALIRGVPGQAEGFQPNAIAGALVIFIPLAISQAVRHDRTATAARALRLGALLVIILTFILTQSRNGWLSLLVGLLAWACWHRRPIRRAVLVSFPVLLGASLLFWSKIAVVLERHLGAGVRADIETRLELWAQALNGIRDFAITGMGMNMFRKVLPEVYPTLRIPLDVDVAHAHNQMLQVALDLGLPGLVAYLALWLGAAAILASAIRYSSDSKQRLTSGALASGMISYFVFGFVDAIALGAKLGLFFWVALALVVIDGERRQELREGVL